MFIVHNFTATVSGAIYDFDFYEYEKKGMFVGESPDLDIIILLPKYHKGFIKAYMVDLIKRHFNNLGMHSAIRHVGTMAFEDDYPSSSSGAS